MTSTGQSTVEIDGQPALGEGCQFTCPMFGQTVSLSKSDQSVGKHNEASFGAHLGSFVLDIIPWVGTGKSILEFKEGKDPITGEEVSKLASGVGIVAGLIPGGKLAAKGVKAAGKGVKNIFKKIFKKKPPKAANNVPVSQAANNKAIAEEISKGHAYDKHILGQPYGKGPNRQVPREFPGEMRTRKQFQDHIEKVMNNPNTPSKSLPNNRMAYWDEEFGATIIKNPGAKDAGTMFQPKSGRAYFDKL